VSVIFCDALTNSVIMNCIIVKALCLYCMALFLKHGHWSVAMVTTFWH